MDAVVQKIAVVHGGSLPAASMAGIQAFKRRLVRAGVKTPVVTVPLEALPADADLVLAPQDLVSAVRERLPDATLVPVATFADQGLYTPLLERLRAEEVARPRASGPVVVTYLGEQRIG